MKECTGSVRTAVVLGAAALTLTACSTGAAQPSSTPTRDASTEFTATATVLDNGSGTMLCLGVIAQSYPPQCDGPLIRDWDWSTVDGAESASGVTWGAFDVTGTWDGTTFTLTRPAAVPDLGEDPDPEPAPATPADAEAVGRAVADYSGSMGRDSDVLMVSELAGRAWVTVIVDDGGLQAEADARYGAGVVVIESRLRPVDRG